MDRGRAIRAIAFLSGVILVGYLGHRALRSSYAWLGDQPEYQLPFRSIVLDPPPPPWYRGGSTGFLEDVRRRARMPATIGILKLQPDELKHAFERSPWTEEVLRIEYPPHGITVGLQYHMPVAIVVTSDRKEYLVDGTAVILPPDDLGMDLARFGEERSLIRISGEGLVGPANPEPGLNWETKAGVADPAPGNELIGEAARLAHFLVGKMSDIDRVNEPALNIHFINPMDKQGRGLFIQNSESTYILWGKSPGPGGTEGLTDEEKWEKLREWSHKEKVRTVPKGDYWQIEANGVFHMRWNPAPESARIDRPAKDGSAIRTKGPGQRP